MSFNVSLPYANPATQSHLNKLNQELNRPQSRLSNIPRDIVNYIVAPYLQVPDPTPLVPARRQFNPGFSGDPYPDRALDRNGPSFFFST